MDTYNRAENERNAMVDECFTHDHILRKGGHFAGGEALQGADTAITLRWKNGKVERDVIRPLAFARFGELLLATAKHPAMLVCLDNAL